MKNNYLQLSAIWKKGTILILGLELLSVGMSSQAATDCNAVTEISTIECESLLELYSSTNGEGWRNNEEWNVTNTPCSWLGITCENGGVTEINLDWNQLTGTIPDFSGLSYLQKLWLHNNKLTGTIPNFSGLPNLQDIWLGKNKLTGTIPNFSGLSNLQKLFLGANQLTGAIPDFSTLPNLQTLVLNSNQLTGAIPDFSALPNLQTLVLYSNQLTGTIPDFIALPKLQVLDLSNNELANVIPNFNALLNLKELDLESNLLTGTIPDFSALTKLESLNLRNNSICKDTSINYSSWQEKVNAFPNCPTYPSQTSVVTDCNAVTEISTIECESLLELYSSTNGVGWNNNGSTDWDNNEVWNVTNTPCSWFGVTCENGSVTKLWLHNNKLTGKIPDFSGLPNLVQLYLGNNQLTDAIPDFSGLPNLKELYLYGNQLTDAIPNFRGLSNLEELWLSDNQLKGKIPDFSELSNLEILYLNNNQLTDAIPNFRGLSNLEELWLSDNQLKGKIPDFSELSNLETLRFDNNQLKGAIPDFSALPDNLRILDLKSNQLTGAISDFTALTELAYLDLRNNPICKKANINYSSWPIIHAKSRYDEDELEATWQEELDGFPNCSVNQLPPTAAFSISTIQDLIVTLDANSSTDSDGTIVKYTWTASDGQEAFGANTQITFSDSGTYDITLTVTDNDGLTGMTQDNVTVSEEPVISNLEAFRNWLAGIEVVGEFVITENDISSIVIQGITYHGQLADEVIPGPRPSELIFEPIGDPNNDGNEDFLFTYPSGDKQVFYYYGILEEQPDPDKLAVLRGRVTTRDAQPLSEVIITIPNHSESAQTRTDGTFSLAVNGGELFTLKYSKAGYLSAQRKVNTEIQGFFWADDVVMIPIEQSQGTTIDLSATNPDTEPMQVVQGPLVESKSTFELNPNLERPSRQPTLFFPQGTTATLADGTPLVDEDKLDVLITEYTVDDDDLAAMPVPLPSGSGYTYAVNISANGETDVELSRPIPFYVNNFLGFKTGTIVPLGRLDDTVQSGWVPEADGRVIKILRIDKDDEGIDIAALDTINDEKEIVDNGSDLDITEDERREIAKQFQIGESFWRVEVTKLGNFDLNWPLRIPDELNIEEMGKIASTASKVQDVDENPCIKSGCIIEAERQVLGETIPVVGVPFNLNYRSSRTSGRNANYKLDIPLQDNNVDTPKRIKLEASIGGHKISKVFFDNSSDNSFDNSLDEPNGPLNTPRYTDEWHIKESYGYNLHGQGNHKAIVRIGYVYDGNYEVPPDITESLTDVQCSTTENPDNSDEPITGSFGCIKTTEITETEKTEAGISIPARQEVTDWQEYTINIGGWFPRSTGLGEWTIDVHHAYDPNDEVLYLGNGSLRQVAPIKQNGKILIASEDGGLVYEFSETGSHLRTIDSLTNQAIYTFSYLNGYLVKIEDIDGDMTTIERNADNSPLSIVAPYGQRTELTLDANGYLASVKNPAAEVHQMVYTDDGLLTQFTNPRNHVANYKYNNLGLLVEDTDFVGGGWKLSRTEESEVNGYLVTMTSKEDRVSRFNVATLDDGTSQRVTTAPDGTQTTVTREIEDNNKITTSERADGTKITLEEGPEPERFGMQAPLATNLKVETPKGLVSTITTERIVELEDKDNPLSLQKLTETVTVNGRRSSSVYDVSAKKMTATSAAGRESVSYLDDKGRVIREHIPNLADVYSSYDERGRLIETRVGDGLDARTATISYDDDNGYISKVTDALDREVSFVYDAVGRVTTQVLTDGREIHYSYDTNGNVTSITPPGQPAHDFAYTPMDLQSQYTPPALADVSEPQTEYEYNLDKQLIGITRPDGHAVTFDYDAASGRLNTMTLPNRQLNYHYDADTGNLNSIVSDADTGNLDSIVSLDEGILMYTYDGSLALSETWGAGSPVLGRVSLTYDNDFRVASSQVNGRHTVNYEYDADSLLIRSGFLLLDYHPQTGFLTDTRLGDLTTQRVYNSFAEMESVTSAYDESVLYQSEYSYDKLGRITQKVETIEGDEITYAYGYDDAGRLVEVTEDSAVTDEYSYDSNGNRLSADTSNGFFEGSYDEQDRLVQYGDTVYKYTENGELSSKDNGGVSTEYKYDVLGNLRTVKLPDKKIEYIIDARSRRFGKRVDDKFTQGFLYQGSLNPIAELGVAGNVVARFVYGSKANVPDYMLKDGKIYRILSDHLGSPRLVVDISDGTVIQRMDYDVFGNVILDTNPGFQPFGFAGGLYDVNIGLMRFGARDYDPDTGRWTAKDPILFDGGDSNLYGYVVNDPVNLIDPEGKILPLLAGIANVGRFILMASPIFGRYVATNPVRFGVITSSAIAGSYFSDGSFIGKHFGALKGGFEGAFGFTSAIFKGIYTAIHCDTKIVDEVMKNIVSNYISGKIGKKLFGEDVGKLLAPWIGKIIQKAK